MGDGEWLKAVPGVKRGVQAGGLGGKTGENRIRQRGCADHDADGELILLSAVKFATLDAYGMGIEMEAESPDGMTP